MSWNVYAEVTWNRRHLWLEGFFSEDAAKRMAETAVRDNPGVVTRAWVEPGAPSEQQAFHDAIRDMRSDNQD